MVHGRDIEDLMHYCTWSSRASPLLLTLAVELHPRDVVSHTLDLPAWQSWFHHGQVGFTAGAGEGRRYVTLHSLGVGDTQDLRRARSGEEKHLNDHLYLSIGTVSQ